MTNVERVTLHRQRKKLGQRPNLRARQFDADGRLVVFVGAGVSSSWWGLNRSVIVALRDRVAELVGRERAEALANAVTARQEGNKFPPEYHDRLTVTTRGNAEVCGQMRTLLTTLGRCMAIPRVAMLGHCALRRLWGAAQTGVE
jgi:hypothetical protein